MKYYLLILIIPVLISCTAAKSFDDGTNGSLSVNTDILSDDGTTAFVSSFYKNEAPLISQNLKDENTNSDSKVSNKNSDNKDTASSIEDSNKKTNLKNDKPEIELVSTKDKSKGSKVISKDKAILNENSKDKNIKDKKTEQPKVPKDAPAFFYPVSNIVIKKEFSSSGDSKNSGVDFSVGTNENIFASGSGVVIFAGEKNSLGKSVFIYHDKGYISIYYNLSSISVTKGSSVSSSDTVVGTASSSFHFELRHQTSSGIEVLNPKNILQKRRK